MVTDECSNLSNVATREVEKPTKFSLSSALSPNYLILIKHNREPLQEIRFRVKENPLKSENPFESDYATDRQTDR